ncbi:Uncharacterized conserved protein [Ceraceosorus bombacis]|uniref:Uncharacterized conserved protein n=1 Tax=Ceraceosorus bombacis TaxID=401625 RepID=A0A0P1BIF4_9BASI|nr:Uncharacterized conserved protein [Ceraceosorus bombacis]
MPVEAGPSRISMNSASSADALKQPISFRELHDHLELSAHRLSPEQLAQALRDRAPQLKSCGRPFTQPSRLEHELTDSSKALDLWNGRSAEVRAEVRLLVNDFSKLHAIDATDTAPLVWLYLESEESSLEDLVRSPSAGAQDSRGSYAAQQRTKHQDELRLVLVAGLTAFYFEERLCILRLIPILLRIADDPSHQHHDLVSDLVQEIATPELALHILSSFDVNAQRPLPESVRGARGDEAAWVKQRLREQLGLLESLFFLYYLRLPSTAAAVLRILDTVRTTSAGRILVGLEHLDKEGTEIHAAVSHLLILVAVESLDLESHMDGEVSLEDVRAIDVERGSNWLDERSLLASPQDVHKAIDTLELLADEPCFSPLLLAWSLVLQKVEAKFEQWFHVKPHDRLPPHLQRLQDEIAPPDTGDTSLWQRLASVALSPASGLFSEMHAIVTSALITTASSKSAATVLAVPASASLAHRAVFKGLLLSVTELVRASFIENLDGLIGLWETTFGSGAIAEESAESMPGIASLCDQFWSEDFNHEDRRALLELAVRRWPVSFRPLVRLATALTGACSIQAIPTFVDSSRDTSERCILAVYRFLASLPSVAQALPRMGVSAPYELISTSVPDAAAYRTTRLMPFFGWKSIRPSTVGTVVSDAGTDVLVVWESADPISAWLILADCLASFAGLLAAPTKSSNQTKRSQAVDDVFTTDETSPALDFDALAPGEDAASRVECVADVLDLFAAVFSGSETVREELLQHLEQGQSDDGLASDHHAPFVDLMQVTLRILEQAVAQRPIISRVVVSALKLLTLLIPSRAADVFVALRSSNLLTGSPGFLPAQYQNGINTDLSTSGVPPSRILQEESSRGQYPALIALLDLHAGLLIEMQRSQFSSTPELMQVKSEVLLRATAWMLESIWVEYQTLPFASARTQVEVGHRITHFLRSALNDVAMSPLTIGNSSASALCGALERALVLGVNKSLVAPIATVLGGGDQLLQGLYASGRYHEAEGALRLVESVLQLTHIIVHRKRQIQAFGKAEVYGNQGVRLGIVESLFYEHTPVAWRGRTRRATQAGVELAAAVLSYALFSSIPSLSIKGAQLITALCGSSKDVVSSQESSKRHQHVPSLSAHFGSPKEIELTLGRLRDLVANEAVDPDLRSAIWTMLASFVDSQPALAQLVLSGHALQGSRGQALSTLPSSDTDRQATEGSGKGSILLVAQDILIKRTAPVETQPALLESILRFAHHAWSHAMEHPHLFDKIRSRKELWTSLVALISDHNIEAPPLPDSCSRNDNYYQTEADEDVNTYGRQQMCIARALSLLCEDMQLTVQLALFFKRNHEAGKSPSRASEQVFLELFEKPKLLIDILLHAVNVQCDATEHGLVEQDHLYQTLPAIKLSTMRRPARLDDFDESRPFGDTYVYDALNLCDKLEGIVPTDKIANEDESVTSDGLPAGWQTDAFLALARINADWSLIDSQVAVLRGWTSLLRLSIGQVGSEILKSTRARELQQNLLSAWIRCATITAEEDRSAAALRGVHSHRVAFLAGLLQVAWGLKSGSIDREKSSGQVGSPADVVKVSQLACQVLTSEAFKVEDSVAGMFATPFHQDVFTIVLICTEQFRQLLKAPAMGAAAGKRASLRRSRGRSAAFDDIDERDAPRLVQAHLHRVVDVFATHTILALRVAADRGVALHSADSDLLLDSVETDVSIISTTLSLLLRDDFAIEPQFWSLHFQSTGLLTSCCDLLRRAHWRSIPNDEIEAGETSHISPEVRFMPSLLHFFATLALRMTGAETLALGGVMAALSSNALSAQLEHGSVRPLSFPHAHNPAHVVWLEMLRLVSGLARSLAGTSADESTWDDASLHFVANEVEPFVRIYGRQVLSTLAFKPLTAASGFASTHTALQGGDDGVSIPLIEEVEATVQLFLVIVSAHNAARHRRRGMSSHESSSAHLVAVLANATGGLIQQVVYLLQHPKETLSLVEGSQTATNDQGETQSQPSAGSRNTRSEQTSNYVSQLLESIATSAVAALVLWSRAMSTLVGSQPLLMSDTSVIAMNSRTAPAAPTSIGTLIDLASFLTDKLRSTKAPEKERVVHLSTALEQTLTLAAAQLVEANQREASRASDPGDAAGPVKRDLTLTRGVQSAIETSRGVLAEKGSGENRGTDLVDLLRLSLQRAC